MCLTRMEFDHMTAFVYCTLIHGLSCVLLLDHKFTLLIQRMKHTRFVGLETCNGKVNFMNSARNCSITLVNYFDVSSVIRGTCSL